MRWVQQASGKESQLVVAEVCRRQQLVDRKGKEEMRRLDEQKT